MSLFSEILVTAARAQIREKDKKLEYKARNQSVKYKNAQINWRKHLYNAMRTKHK